MAWMRFHYKIKVRQIFDAEFFALYSKIALIDAEDPDFIRNEKSVPKMPSLDQKVL